MKSSSYEKEKLETLLSISYGLYRAKTFQEIAESVSENIQKFRNEALVAGFKLAIYDNEIDEYFLVFDLLETQSNYYNTKIASPLYEPIPLKDVKYYSRIAIDNRKTFVIQDSHSEYSLSIDPRQKFLNEHTMIFIPLIHDQTLVGLISFAREPKNSMDEDFISFLESISNYVSISVYNLLITNKRKLELIEQKVAKESLKLEETRLQALLNLNQMTNVSVSELTHFAMEEAVRLTQSKLGYIAFVNKDETVLTMYAWSISAMRECKIIDKPIIYQVSETGLWGETIRQRKPVITNDYAAPNPFKKGYPNGHVHVLRHMNVPIFDNEKIVIVAGVGNKEGEYNDTDVMQLTLLMSGMWRIVQRKQAEEALQIKSDELNRFFSVAIDLLCIADTSGYFRRLNPAWETTLGYTLSDMEGKKFLDFVHPDDVDNTIHELTKLSNQQNVLNFVNRYRCKDGSYRWIEWRSYPVGELIYAAARDITERKKMEEALNQKIIALTQPFSDISNITFNDLFDLEEIQTIQDLFAKATGVASIITETDGTPITKPSNFCKLCNDIIRNTEQGKINCYYSDSVIGKYKKEGPIVQRCLSGSLWDAGASITIGDRHIANWLIGQVIDEHMDMEEMLSYAREIGADEKDYMQALKDVKRMPKQQFEIIADALYWIAKQLSLLALQNIQQAREISNRRKIEESLKISEEKYRLLFENMTSGFALHEIICDDNNNTIDYKYLEANPAFENLTGIPIKSLTGKRVTEVLPTVESYWINTFGKVAQTGEPLSYINHVEEMGKYFETFVFSPQKNQFAVIFNDITGRIQAEDTIKRQINELESKNAELERFTYTVSHDLKSPLITIKGFLGHLVSDAKSGRIDRMESDTKRISNAADKMQSLLEDLLELSRIGRIINPSSEFQMSAVVKEAMDLLFVSLKEKGIKIIYDKGMPVVHGDKIRIREVWQNLIENSVKYLGEQKSPEIEIGFRKEKNEIIFYIKDNGMGIEEKYHYKIFGLFEKLNPSSEGTGIGLALVKRIIELHGGQIWVNSEGKGKGAEFCFKLNRGESL